MVKKKNFRIIKYTLAVLVSLLFVLSIIMFYNENFNSAGFSVFKTIIDKSTASKIDDKTNETKDMDEQTAIIKKEFEELLTPYSPIYAIQDEQNLNIYQNIYGRADEENINKLYPNIYGDFTELKYKGYIIQLREPSLIDKKIELEKSVQAGLRRDTPAQINAQLRTHVSRINREHNSAKASLRRITEIRNNEIIEYKKSFNGIAIAKDLSQEQLEQIKNLPQVERISPNYEVKIALYEGPVEINNQDDIPENIVRNDNRRRLREAYNPFVWHLYITNVYNARDLGYSGEGVTIAIIDTGIDSNHADLRGKVIEEHCYSVTYGCPNRRNEQHGRGAGMDGLGHGTHVAGIAAGNLFGVAPNASLVSIRVLSSEGRVYMSDVLRGIEIAVDPNEDNNFEDHYDIISMSLGGGGTPDEPDAIAVDNAVNLGVVAVIAAGNSGPVYRSVGCPGCARKAITIGASDSQDNVARFSSRGPTSIGTIKPDVVAPGVNICSAQFDDITPELECYDDEHVAWQGTSMSTPLVAGAVALIKQAHPDWSPAEIKMALRNTAVDLNEDIFTQGYGRVDVLDAVSLEHAPPVAELFTSGEVNGEINIQGIASENNFTLYYGKGRDPQQWIEIECREGMSNDSLCLFDTSYNQETEYILKLSVSDENGQISEDKTLINVKLINVSNTEITNPLDYDFLRAGDIIEINGSILNNGLINYEIEWGVGEEPEEWFTRGVQLINNGRNNINNNVIGYWDTSSINEANPYTLRLKVNTTEGIVYDESFIYLDPRIKEGWPVTIESSFSWIVINSPVISDLNNDGNKKLVFLAQEYVLLGGAFREEMSSKLYILEEDGEIISNLTLNCVVNPSSFPSISNIYGNVSKEIVLICSGRNGGKMIILDSGGNVIQETNLFFSLSDNLYGAIVLDDINKDDSIEIIYGGRNYGDNAGSYLVALDKQGRILSGFPVQLENTSWSSSVYTPAIGNLDQDEDLEIVVISYTNSLSNIRAYDSNGSLLWSQEIESKVSNDPAIADVNNDGYNEVIFTSRLGVHILNRFGEYILDLRLGDSRASSNIALGDLDNDNDLEIIFGYGIDIYAMHHNGDVVFSYRTNNASYTNHPPIVGDINGDGSLDIIFNSYNDIYALSSQGELLEGFPIQILPIAYSSPSIEDIDNDGNVELITSSTWLFSDIKRGRIYVFDLEGRYNPLKMPWPMFQHDPQHTGLYKYSFSCFGEYFMIWRNGQGNIIRQDPYNILSDRCNGFRCLSNNNEISPSCYNQTQCNAVCTGSSTCLNISEWQGICRQQPRCGNNIRERQEQCDGRDLNNTNCRSLGFSGGTLRCSNQCRFDTSRCSRRI